MNNSSSIQTIGIILLTILASAVIFISCKSQKGIDNKSKVALVSCYCVSQNSMYIDQNGELPKPHVSDTTTVKVRKGDTFNNYIKVLSVNEKEIEINFEFGQYSNGNGQSGTKFKLNRGESASFYDMTILDESRTIHISVK